MNSLKILKLNLFANSLGNNPKIINFLGEGLKEQRKLNELYLTISHNDLSGNYEGLMSIGKAI